MAVDNNLKHENRHAQDLARNLEQLRSSSRLNDGRWDDPAYMTRLRLKGRAIAGMISMMACWTRLERPGFERFLKASRGEKPVVVVAWHSSMIVPAYVYRNQDLVIMSSLSQAGDLMACVMVCFGYHSVRGSSSKGGMRGLLEMVKLMKNGRNGSLTVDGPRGPKHEVKPGAVLLAQKAGADIIPIGMGYSHCLRLNNWDGTEIPLPGARAVLYTGKPFALDANATVEDGCRLIRDRLMACEAAAAEYIRTGVVPEV
jgi:lysophospholipid acyltransferase (LPLAT)-like uncharacterized protein